FALTACGGSGGGYTPFNAGANPTPAPVAPSGKSTATIKLTLPEHDADATTAAAVAKGGVFRHVRPDFISPAQNTFTFLIDGQKALYVNQTTNQTVSTPTSNGSTIVFSGESSGSVYTITLNVTTTPGEHLIGAVIQGNVPAWVLSEGQRVYNLAPGPNANLATLALNGAMGTAYVECATAAQNVAGNNCNDYANFNPVTGLYTFTAVAADADGFPIVQQSNPYGPGNVPFDNGSFTVVETTATPILTVTNAGPYGDPGSTITGPSGGYYVPGIFTYGQGFNVQCNSVGQATLGLQIAQSAPTAPVTGFTYPAGTYPAAGVLPAGDKVAGNPNYHNGNNPNPVTNILSVSCQSNGTIVIT
ncbi:MAG: hypothetical protein ACLQPV_05800, partial [Vulcanimicrobiaceae bacterium]